ADHQYYDGLVRRLKNDTAHIQYVMDTWGKPITAAGAQSLDGKSAFVLLRLAGDIGQMEANKSVEAVKDMIDNDTPPAGLKVYVSGAAPLASDTLILVEMLVARGVVATLGHFGYIELSSFAVNIVISLTLGAGTDYGIFLLGRYHEARNSGLDREDAFYAAYRGVSHVIIGSGLTIAGAGLCLSFARLNYFHTMGPAVAIGMLLTIAAALTLGPAMLHLGSLFGLFDPKQRARAHLYRRIGASVVRWPKPILVASSAAVLVGAVFVPTYQVSYDDRAYQPSDAPAKEGFAAADRHFPPSKLFTEMLMVESDHDMRNSADFISLDRVSKSLVRLPGVAMVQSITRPMGRALEHASLPYLFTTQGSGNGQQLPFTKAQNANTDQQAKIMAHSVAVLRQTTDLTQKLADEMHNTVVTMEDMQQVTQDMNEKLAADIKDAVGSLEVVDRLLPQMVALLKLTANDQDALQALIVNTYGQTNLQATATDQTFDDLINVGNDFDASRSDDFFYIPHEAFDNEDIKTGMTLMMSPDGKAARFIVTHMGNAMGPEGIEHVNDFPDAITTALKETSLAGSKVYIGGAGSNNKDIKEYAASDLLIAAIAAFTLIFLIMMVITRSLVAPFVIIGTVAFSFAGAFGLSVLIWQHLVGLPLHWLILPLTFI
ncbi:Siderophore exporter MmpL4, partial [Aduncisulcus paluster]